MAAANYGVPNNRIIDDHPLARIHISDLEDSNRSHDDLMEKIVNEDNEDDM